jgi:hypothetical protein
LSMTPSPSFCLSQASYSNVKWPIFKLLYSQSRFDEKVIEQVQFIYLHTVPLQLKCYWNFQWKNKKADLNCNILLSL